MRREFPARVRAAAFERCGGLCEGCQVKLSVGAFHFDHVLPDALSGEPILSNVAVLCKACHGKKTATVDVPQIAKSNRQRAGYLGKPQSRSPLPGGKGSKWKRTFGKGWVLRAEERTKR